MSKARCRNCGVIVESKHRHDFVTCSCFRNESNTRGFFLDGGKEYTRYGGNRSDIEWLELDEGDNDNANS